MGYKDLLVSTCAQYKLLRNQAAYVLATADWETNHTFLPVKEAYYVKSKDLEAWRKKNLRYYPWYGRGFVQITWEPNYLKAGKAIGVDLIANPDLAMEPENAAKIIVLGMKEGWFTGKKLRDYITLTISGFVNARRIVNGTDKAKEIADLAKKYDAELTRAGYGVTAVKAPPAVSAATAKVAAPMPEPAPSAAASPMIPFPPTPLDQSKEPQMNKPASDILATATRILLPTILHSLKKDSTPVPNALAPEIAAAVAKDIAPILVNSSNNEPLWQSRIIWGLGVGVIATVAGLVGITIDPASQSQIVDLAQKGIAAGAQIVTLIGLAYALYGRLTSKKPLGQQTEE